MKDIIVFLNEAKTFDENTKVGIGDSSELLSFLKNEIENLDGNIKISGDGIKYNNVLIPNTKLSLRLTAGEYADKLINYINDLNDKKANAKPIKLRKRKDNSWRSTTNGR